MKTRLIAFLLILVLLLATLSPAAGEPSSLAETEALLWALLKAEVARSGADSLQQWADTALASTAGTGAEWFALGLSQLQAEGLSLSAYRQALEAYVENSGVLSPSTRQKLALCLLAAGGSAGAAEAAETIGQQGIMSWIFGLHLLNNGCQSSLYTAEEAAAQLCAMQLEDGGWALMGKTADADVTAMVLQALAPHRQQPPVEAAVQRALALLSEKQLPDGGYASMGAPNPESAAQVMIALCGLGIDPMQDERFIKEGHTLLDSLESYVLPDGGYVHTMGGEYNAAATMQVFLGLAAHYRLLQGREGLFLLDAAGREMPGAADPATAGSGSYSVGIIGGADGPTAIFIAGSPGWKLPAAALLVLLALVWCAVQLLRGRRSWKHWLLPLLIALLGAVLLLCIDIQTPESYYGSDILPEGEPIGSVVMEIRCDTLPANTGDMPQDGVILSQTAFPLWQGDTVFDLLTRAARQHHIQLDTSGTPGMMYVSAIHYLYEQAYGELSGWMYLVNGQTSSQSCDQYTPADGDSILWAYTCEMGADLH